MFCLLIYLKNLKQHLVQSKKKKLMNTYFTDAKAETVYK